MRVLNKFILSVCITTIAFSLVSCTESPPSASDSDERTSIAENDSDDSDSGLTDCGTVVDGELENPVNLNPDALFPVRIVGENRAAVTVAGEEFLVKLHGVRSNGNDAEAVEFLNRLASGNAFFVEAIEDCMTTVEGGAQAFVGQLFTPGGRSYSEALLMEGLAGADASDPCGVRDILSCYQALEEDALPEEEFVFDEDDFDDFDDSFVGGGSGPAFLWKPVSERDGNLVILLQPFGATVSVNGQRLENFGPSNGRGTTARANRPGCAFGRDVTVTAVGIDGERLTFPNGRREVIISNGCNRVEMG